MPKTIQVLVVDDSTFMRKSLSTMLSSDPRIAVAGMARNGEEAIQQVKALKPDDDHQTTGWSRRKPCSRKHTTLSIRPARIRRTDQRMFS